MTLRKTYLFLLLFSATFFYSCSLVGPDKNTTDTHEVLLPVIVESGWGYIDLKGTVVIPPTCDYGIAYEFNNGRGIVRSNSSFLLINDKNEVILDNEYLRIFPFSEERALVGFNNTIGYINKQGKTVIQLQYSSGSSFKNGYAIVRDFSREYLIIDKNGNEFYAPDSSQLNLNQYSLLDTERILFYKNRGFGYFNINGEIEIEPKYERAEPFNEGVAFVRLNDQWMLIDRNDSIVFELSDETLRTRPFFNNRAFVMDTSRYWRLINKQGNFVSDERYEQIIDFSENRAIVRVDDKWKIIDVDANTVFNDPFSPTSANPFKHGVLQIRREDLPRSNEVGYIDTLGNYLWYPTY